MSRIDNNDKHIKHAVNKIKEDANQLLLVEFRRETFMHHFRLIVLSFIID